MASDKNFFQRVQDGELPRPPAADTLGWSLRNLDTTAGTIEVGFEASPAFTNPVGHVQGGFLAAMLDDTLGPALVATLDDEQFAPTLDLQVQFLRPAHPGTLIGHGRVVRRGGRIAHLAGELRDAGGRVVATATATAMIVETSL
ncbi:MAG: PaaI family thioesterase [Acidimicrobiales bacterium]